VTSDDLAREILFQLWRSFGSFDSRVRFSTWMYRTALNLAISFYRRESARARHVMAGGEGLLESIGEARRIQRTFKHCSNGSENWIR
jgi:DNA-directed RNA polymerase specialized sigma24 family protein